ncbi:MAG: AzlD domain-containing protein [Acidimicrobiales bacterium]
MTAPMATVLILAVISYGFKSVGPLVLGGERNIPMWVDRLALLLPAPLLAALVATSTFVTDRQWSIDARAVGLLVAVLALWRRLPFVIVVVLAAASTALTRQLL